MCMLYTVFSSPTLQAAATALDERHHPRRAPRRFLVDVEQTSHHPRRRRAPRNSATLVDVEPLGERQRPRRRAASASPSPGFRQRRKPLRTLLRGFTWVRRQASKPDIGAGHIAVTAIPGPTPVSGVANSLVGVGVPCSADQIVPPHPFRPTATVADGELHCADPVRTESGAQQ